MDKKVNYKSVKTYIAIALFSTIILLNFLYNNQYIRIVVITIIFIPFILEICPESSDVTKSVLLNDDNVRRQIRKKINDTVDFRVIIKCSNSFIRLHNEEI